MPSPRDKLIARVVDGLHDLLGYAPLARDEIGDLEERLCNVSDARLEQLAVDLEDAGAILDGEALERGWSYRHWGQRSHYCDRPGHTLCGRSWDGGMLEARAPEDGDCKRCAASLAKRLRTHDPKGSSQSA